MDNLERLIPETVLTLHHGERPVIRVIAHPPTDGKHPGPIVPSLTCVEIITDTGDRRWYGFERAWIGPDLRMHVAPIDPRDEVVRGWEKP